MLLKNVFNKIISFSFYTLLFLTPLIMTPYNYELFEFNKMIFVYGMTIIIAGAWLGKAIVEAKLIIKRTPLDVPIALCLLSSVLSTIFSINPHTSIWGYYSRFHGGLLSTICYIVLYYSFVSNFNQQKTLRALNVLLASAFLVCVYGVLERFGIDQAFWVQDVKNRVFSTLGQPNWLGAFINSLIFIPLGLLLANRSRNTKNVIAHFSARHAIFYILYTIFFLCLIFTNSKSAILAFWLGLLVFSFLIQKGYSFKGVSFLRKLLIVWVFSLVIYTLFGGKTYNHIKKAPGWLNIFTNKVLPSPPAIPPTPDKPFISESSDIRKIVWLGALKIFKAYPVFGSGLETFSYSYYRFKPVEHNLLSEWDFLYNKAHNEFLNILACQGALGIITYLFLIGSFIFWIIKILLKKDPSISQYLNILISLFTGYLTILITNFFGFSVVVIGLLFFLIPAFCFCLADTCQFRVLTLKFTDGKVYVKTRSLQYLQLVVLTLVAGYLLIKVVNLWRADFYFNQGEKYYQSDWLVNSITNLEKAILLNPAEPLYHSQMAQSAVKLTTAYNEIDSSESAKLVNDLKDLSLKEIELTLELNPVHLNYYKHAVKVYIYLSLIEPEFKNKAIEVLNQAIKLAPNDAKLYYNLGLLYEQQNKLNEARTAWQKALKLKPNYYQVRDLLNK